MSNSKKRELKEIDRRIMELDAFDFDMIYWMQAKINILETMIEDTDREAA